MSNDSTTKTIAVAAGLCIVCAIIVSVASTLLKSKQEENKLLDKQTNVLRAAGLVDLKDSPSAAKVKELFKQVQPVVIDLTKGTLVPEATETASDSKTPIPADIDIAGIKNRPDQVVIYCVKDEQGKVQTTVLPIYGRGLWSTMYGFLALKGDGKTVQNLTFYDHGETPGLGGEISNPVWVGKWSGKTAIDPKGEVVIQVIKGNVDPSSNTAASSIDGISGATLTGNGVNRTVRYWLGDAGYGKFLKSQIN